MLIRRFNVVSGALICSLAGCSGGGMAEIGRYEPGVAAEAVMKAYDTSGDNAIDESELRQSEALSDAAARIDQDQDGKLTIEEIASRIEMHQTSDPKLISVTFVVTKAGDVLTNTKVSLEMESFQGESLPVYEGESNEGGEINVQTSGSLIGGVLPPGFYRARLTTDDGTTKERGLEIANDILTFNGIMALPL